MTVQRALIVGGTKGLGWALAHGADDREMSSIVTGRNTPELILGSSSYRQLDVAEPTAAWHEVLHDADDPQLTHLFLVAGIFLKRALGATSPHEIEAMVRTHLLGPINFMRRFHQERLLTGAPYHLTVIASTSSFKMREDETVYAAVKAGKAAFARQFAAELARDLPGSKTLLVNPGGMKSGFLQAAGIDVSKMMDTFAVADLIWKEIDAQTTPFREMNILRLPTGAPRVVYGPQTPETL